MACGFRSWLLFLCVIQALVWGAPGTQAGLVANDDSTSNDRLSRASPTRLENATPSALPPGAQARLGNGTPVFVALAFSNDGKLLASGGFEKTITIWDAATGNEIRKWNGPECNIAGLAFSPDGRLLASGSVSDNNVHLWEVATGREISALAGLPRGATSLAFSPDKKVVAAGGFYTPEVHLWSTDNGHPLAKLVGPRVPLPELEIAFGPRMPSDSSHVAFAPDGKILASGHRHGLIRVWDASTLREIGHFRATATDNFVHVAFSPDGRYLASWGVLIRLWRKNAKSEWKQFRFFGEQPDLRVAALAISPDGRMIASSSSWDKLGDDKVHIWEVATGLERCQLDGHKYAIHALAFSPDGLRLASGSQDGTALIWDVRRLPQAPVPGIKSDADLESRWGDLADGSAPTAFRAIQALARNPERAVSFLKERMRPVFQDEARRLHQLVAALDSDSYQARRQATEELAMQVELANPVLRRARSGITSLESRRRLEQILHAGDRAIFSGRQLQLLRGIEVLENIGSPHAKTVLEAMARGTPEFQITQEANASLERLSGRR
jgi:dipeptidyl aminopeptidase/acylaminoacyl peptidase